MVVDLFNTVYRLLVLFLRLFPPDVSTWWWTYLTWCITYWYCCYCTVRTVMSLIPPGCVRVVVDLFNTEVSLQSFSSRDVSLSIFVEERALSSNLLKL